MTPFSREEMRTLQSRAAMYLANLGEFSLYFMPSTRRIAARSIYASRRFKLPADALHVGAYRHPFPAQCIVQDVVDLLATLPDDLPPVRNPEVVISAQFGDPAPAAPMAPAARVARTRRRPDLGWLFAK